MGQKVNPIGFRTGEFYNWSSRWVASDSQYRKFLLEDFKIRKLLMEKLRPAGIAKVEIERLLNKLVLRIHVSRPGVVIGRGGQGLTELKKFLIAQLDIRDEGNLELNVEDIKNPDLSAYLVATYAAEQLGKRMPSRRIMNQAVDRVMRSGAKGVRILLAGRIGGAEIARKEQAKSGSIPLHTLRANIDFAKVDAHTQSGIIGVKVWINKGE
ncbi:30S ribosomal protein S3 [Candidatus Daviesbacteria bacterium]|nr:30S ribosomal protein S3 [Candidatus Daviesbacteria bacterium]